MSYIEDNLVPGEEILYRAKLSIYALITPIVMLAILLYLATRIDTLVVFIVVVFSLYFLLRIFLVFKTTEFALTNRRIIAKKGILHRHSIEIVLNKVESITVNQPLDGRIWGYGTVIVTGSGGTQESFRMIDHPMELRKMVNTRLATIG
jgi:uncharacterized membrane protein YdbT with pleckstrin-like domain